MDNPIPHCGLFATPQNWSDLMDWIERHSGGEKIAAITAAHMALNLAHAKVEGLLTATVSE